MEKLSRSSSGLRHLRWAREILATLEAHYEHNPRLSQPDREVVLEEAINLRTLVTALSSAVKPYRDFLERRRVQCRGMQRVGIHLCAEARAHAEKALLPLGAEGLLSEDRTRRSHGTPDGPRAMAELTREASSAMRQVAQSVPGIGAIAEELAEAAAILDGFNEAFSNLEARERLPLRSTLEGAIEALREGLADMDEHLGARISQPFVASLYPKLTREGSIVADEGDGNDDASAKA